MQVVLPDNTTLSSIPNLPSAVVNAWTARGLTAVSANQIHFPSGLTPNVWDDISPHIAVAYRLSDKWVLRGGYGIYYLPMPLSQILQSMRVNPPLNLRYQNSLDDLNGTNGVYTLTGASATDKLGVATVNPAAVNANAQKFLAMDVHNWADNGSRNGHSRLSVSLRQYLCEVGLYRQPRQQSAAALGFQCADFEVQLPGTDRAF